MSALAASGSSYVSTEAICVVNGLLVETRSFSWKIENFDVIRKCSGLLYAQKFHFRAGDSIGLPIKLECYLSHPDNSKKGSENKNGIGAYYRILEKPDDEDEVNAGFFFKIKKANGEKYFTGHASVKNMADEEASRGGWGFEVITERELQGQNIPLVDGCLIIETEFKLFAPKPKYDFDMDLTAKMAEFDTKSMAQVRNDFNYCRTRTITGVNADLSTKIISSDLVEFPVNRGILTARSRVFQRMFRSGMKETRTGIIQLDDLTSKTVNVLLQYICTGALHEDWKSGDVIEELTYAAQKYELQVLIEFLDDVLALVCTKQNAGKLAVMAKKLSMKKAEAGLFHFIKNQATSLDDLVIDFAAE